MHPFLLRASFLYAALADAGAENSQLSPLCVPSPRTNLNLLAKSADYATENAFARFIPKI